MPVLTASNYAPAGGPRHYSTTNDFIQLKANPRQMELIKRRLKGIVQKNDHRLRLRSLKRGGTLIVRSAKQKAPRSAGFLASAPGKKKRQGNYTGGRKKATGAWRMIQHRTGKPPNPGASSIGIGVHRSGFYLRFHETGYFAVGRRSRTAYSKKRGVFTTRRAVSRRGVRQYSKGTTWVPPQPFLRPALHEQKKPAANLMVMTYWKGITKGLPAATAGRGGIGATYIR